MLLHRISPFAVGRYFISSVVRQCSSQKSAPRSLVHKVYPYANIKITSNYHLNIKPYDLLDCPDGNLLRISLQQKNSGATPTQKITEFIANFDANVQIDDQNITIDTVDDLGTQVTPDELANSVACLIEVPVKANLKIFSKRDISVQNMYSDDISVTSKDGDVTTKSIQSVNLSLTTENGNIRCDGTTLAHKMDVRCHGEKNIHLNQVLGDSLNAISENGTITTNSCYAENSKFITQKGGLNLKNVHKKSELYVLNGGYLDVTGFHGILNATTNGGKLNFQLTEIHGESSIEAQNPTQFDLNISEFVEEHTCLAINANQISLDSTLNHFEIKNNGDGVELQNGNRDMCDDLLTIRTNGDIKLGKLSWMDTMKLKLSAQTQDSN